jgi:hypothetical protein
MTTDYNCEACSSGCTARHTDEKASEEVKAAPYLVIAGIIIVLVSFAYRVFF